MFIRAFKPLKLRSFFLFGARGTGKSTLLKTLFSEDEAVTLSLLSPTILNMLQASPAALEPLIATAIQRKQWIVLDEIQKVPELLDVVHLYIEKYAARFAMTGSSARKLRRGASNLLAGRALVFNLFPLLQTEIGSEFNLLKALQWGTLPEAWTIISDQERSLYLQSYCETYLKEEILVEQIIRNLPPFRRFLNIAAQSQATLINYAKIAADIQTDPTNVRNYFQILEDTLLGFCLEPFHNSIRKRQRQSPKFYWIDTGISRTLAGMLDVPIRESTFEFGKLFESFVVSQIRAGLTYQSKQFQLSYLRTKDGAEIDLIVERGGQATLLLEIKSATNVRAEDIAALNTLGKDIPNSISICLYRGSLRLKFGSVEVLPWEIGLHELGLVGL